MHSNHLYALLQRVIGLHSEFVYITEFFLKNCLKKCFKTVQKTKKVCAKTQSFTSQCWEVAGIGRAAQLVEGSFCETSIHRPFSRGVEGSYTGQRQ